MESIKKKESFSQSVFSLMVSQVIVKILGLFYRLYLTNRNGFGDEGNAIANGGFQIFALVLSIIAIGIPTAISKLIAQTTARGNYKGAYKIFKVALIIFSLLGIAGSYSLYRLSGLLANNYIHIEETRLSIIALAPSVFLVSVISIFKGFFSGRNSIKMTAHAQSLDQLTKTISTVAIIELSVFIYKKTNTEAMAAYSNLATTLGNIVELGYLYYAYLKEKSNIRLEIKKSRNNHNIRVIEIVKQILIVAIPISLTALISTISKNIDSITIVNDLKGIIGYEEAKKQYGILSGKVDALVNFPLSFNMAIVTALLPSIASTNGNLKLQAERINQSFLLGLTIAFPITFIFYGFSNEILGLLFPNASAGGDILRISSFQILFITVEQITNIILNGIGENIIPIKAITSGVIIKAILNKILVTKTDLSIGGTNGAAIATVVCHIIAVIISVTMLKKKTNIKISIKNIIKPFCSSIVMIFISKLVYKSLIGIASTKINLLISLLVGSCVFFIIANSFMPIKIFRIKRNGKKEGFCR